MALYEETKKIQEELNDKFSQTGLPQNLDLGNIELSDYDLSAQGEEPVEQEPVQGPGVPTITFTNPVDELRAMNQQVKDLLISRGQEIISPDEFVFRSPHERRNIGKFFDGTYDPSYQWLEDEASRRQRAAVRTLYMIPRIGAKVAVEAANMMGSTYGLLAWLTTGFQKDKIGLLVNNAFHRAVLDVEERIKAGLPVYVSDRIKNGSLFDNIFSSQFWATEGADGVGFLLSFLIPGQAMKALNFGAKTAKLLKPGLAAASKYIKAGEEASSAVGKALATTNVARGIDMVGASVINTVFEAVAEGGESYRNVLQETNDVNKAANAAADVVSKNFLILLPSNFVDQWWLFRDIRFFKREGSDLARKSIKENILSKVIDPKTGKPIAEAYTRSAWSKAGKRVKLLLEGTMKEGVWEEGVQFASQEQAKKEALGLDLDKEDENLFDELVDVARTYIESLSDVDMQKSMFLGSVLGGGEAQIAVSREWAAERRLLEGTEEYKPSAFARFWGAKERPATEGLRQLVNRNWNERYASVLDLAYTTKDADGNIKPVYDDDGNIKLDPAKVEAFTIDKLASYLEKMILIEASKANDETTFRHIRKKLNFRYMYPFISQEGGLSVLLKHIDALAEADKKYFIDEGMDPAMLSIEDIKEELRKDAEEFYEVYNRVNNTHELYKSDIKKKITTPEDEVEFEEFNKLVKDNKISEELTINFYDNVITELRDKLAKYKIPVSSKEKNLSKNLVSSLEESFKAAKEDKSNNITPTDESFIRSSIDTISKAQDVLSKSRDYLANLYDLEWLKKAYSSFVKNRKAEREAKPSLDDIKAAETAFLTPKLKDLWDSSITYELDANGNSVKKAKDIILSYSDTDPKTGKTVTKTIVGKIDRASGANIVIKAREVADTVDDNGNPIFYDTPEGPEFTVTDDGSNVTAPDGKQYSITKLDIASDVKREDIQEEGGIDKQQDFNESWLSLINGLDVEIKRLFTETYGTAEAPRHPFFGVTSWLVSTGNINDVNEKGAEYKHLARWYTFVSKYAMNIDGTTNYFAKTFAFNQIASLPENDPIRLQVKFYTGNTSMPLMTYDQIMNMPQGELREALIKEASKDIKIVIYNKQTLQPHLVGDNVTNKSESPEFVLYNSLPDPDSGRPLVERFSIRPLVKLIMQQNPGITEDHVKELVERELKKSVEQYRKLREEFAKRQFNLDIVTINGGYRVHTEEENDVSDVITNDDIKNPKTFFMSSSPSESAVEIRFGGLPVVSVNVFGSQQYVVPGCLYAVVNNRLEHIKPKTFGETNSVEDIINIIRYLASFQQDEYTEELEKFLYKIVYINYDNPDFRFFIRRYVVGGQRVGFKSLVFGKNELTVEQIRKGEGLDLLRKFLSNKYWNFSMKELKKESTFTEYRVVWEKNKKPVVKAIEWSVAKGGYRGFLFSTGGRIHNVSKGTMRVIKSKKSKNVVEFAVNLQHVNQSLSFKFRDESIERILGIEEKPEEEKKPTATKGKKLSQKLSEQQAQKTGKGKKVIVSQYEEVPGGIKLGREPITEEEKEPKPGKSTKSTKLGNKKNIKEVRQEEVEGGVQLGRTLLIPEEEYNKLLGGQQPTEEPAETKKQTAEAKKQPAGKKTYKVSEKFGVVANETTSKTPDIVWEELSDRDRQFLLDMTGGNVEAAKQLAFRAKFNSDNQKDNHPELFRIAKHIENFELEDLQSKMEWFKNKFPQIAIHISDKLIFKRVWGQLTSSGFVLISPVAAKGTVYHEAFHVYCNLFLSEEERKKLYDETRRVLKNKNLTDKEVEEFLADEFMEYMLAPEAYQFGKEEQHKKSWFRKLLELILSVFGIDIKDPSADKITAEFKKIVNTSVFTIDDNTLRERILKMRDEYSRRITIPGVSEKRVLYMVQDLNYEFFQTIFDPGFKANEEGNILFNLSANITDIYKDVKAKYYFLSKNEPEPGIFTDIFKNFDDLVKLHKVYLSNFRINLTEEEIKSIEDIKEPELIANDNGEVIDFVDSDEYKTITDYRDSHLINLAEYIDNPIRMLIAGLPNVTTDRRGMIRSNITDLETRSTIKYHKRIRLLMNNLWGLTSFEDMAGRILELSKRYPDLVILLKRLGYNPLQPDAQPTPQQHMLRAQFVRTFSNNKIVPLIFNIDREGKRYFIDASSLTIERLLKNEWLNNAVFISDIDDSYVFRDDDGKIYLDSKIVIEDITDFNRMRGSSEDKLEAALNILFKMGIDFEKYSIKDNPTVLYNYLDTLRDQLIKKGGKKILVRDLYNKNVIKNQKELDALIEAASTAFKNDVDLSYVNYEGNREQTIVLNCSLTNLINTYNKLAAMFRAGVKTIPEQYRYLFGWNKKSKRGDLYARNSLILNRVLNGKSIEISVLKGLRDFTGTGKKISRAEIGEYKAATFNALLDGWMPMMRSAERSYDYMLRVERIVTDAVSPSDFAKIATLYLKDELATTFAYFLNPVQFGKHIVKYSENIQHLRVFRFVEDAIGVNFKEFVEANKNKEWDKVEDGTIVEADNLVNKFLERYKNDISIAFNAYYDRALSLTKQSLIDDNVVVKAESINGQEQYAVPGLDLEILEKLNIPVSERGTISAESLNKLITMANTTYFIGANEQFKIILGDPANYTDATDLFKRITGATSPKYTLFDDDKFHNFLDEHYKRLDGKKRGHTFSVVVVDDYVISNEELAKIYEEYRKIKTTDAQSYGTLDFIRDLMLQHGNWYEKHEMTYQYETQKFVLKVLELQKQGRKLPIKFSEEMFTDPAGMFYMHTNGKVPKKPMYKGKVIDEMSLATIEVLKPQGFGAIDSYEVDGRVFTPNTKLTNFFKTSLAPIFFSDLDENSPIFDFVLNMIANQQDVFTFPSSQKGVFVGDENGKPQVIYDKNNNLTTNRFNHQNIRYDSFGIQLDDHHKSYGEVTVSQQRLMLEFLDVFDVGEPAKEEYKKLLRTRVKYAKANNDLIEGLFVNTLESLGLEQTEDGGFYLPDESIDKFVDRFIKAIERRYIETNITDGVELSVKTEVEIKDPVTGEIKKQPAKLLDGALAKFKVEEYILSLIKDGVLRRKTSGDLLTQVSAFMYENPRSGQRRLRFYRKEGDKVAPMEVMISLPRNLIEFVQAHGGLDVINDVIDKYNKGLLKKSDVEKYGDLFRLLTISSNRTPAQSLASLEIMRVVKFLPPYQGAKVVVPFEHVVKTNSDFDIDKLFAYYNKFIYDRNTRKITYIKGDYKGDTIGALTNAINEAAEKAFLHPARFNEIIKPVSAAPLKDIIEEEAAKSHRSPIEVASASPTFSDAVQWWCNMQKAFEFWSSKHAVATCAVHISTHPNEQAYPIKLRPDLVPLLFKGQEVKEGEVYTSGHLKDLKGNYVSDALNMFMSAFVDAIKDPFVFAFANKRIMNSVAFLTKFGKDAPTSLDTLVSFYTADVIKEFQRQASANRASFLTPNMFKKRGRALGREDRVEVTQKSTADIYNSIVKDLIKSLTKFEDIDKYAPEAMTSLSNYLNVPIDYNNTIASVLSKYLFSVDPISEEKTIIEIKDKLKKYKYKYLSDEDIQFVKRYYLDEIEDTEENRLRVLRTQVQMLDMFLMYSAVGWVYIRVCSLIRPQSAFSFGRHFTGLGIEHRLAIEKVLMQNIFTWDSIKQNLLGSEDKPSMLYAFNDVKVSTSEAFDWASIITRYKPIRDFFYKEVFPKLLYRKKLTRKDRERYYDKITAHFMSFVFADYYNTLLKREGYNLRDIYIDIMKGTEDSMSAAEEVIEWQREKDAPDFIKELEPVIQSVRVRSGVPSEVHNVTMMNKHYDAFEYNMLESSFFETFSTSPEDEQAFMNKLMLLNIFQTGFMNNMFSFSRMVPNRIFTPIMVKALAHFANQEDSVITAKLQSFLVQFHMNNVNDRDIVVRYPYIRRFVGGHPEDVIRDNRNFYNGIDYLAIDYYLGDPAKYRENGVTPPVITFLYKRDNAEQEGNVFRRITTLGDTNKFNEYYPDLMPSQLADISILEHNRYDGYQKIKPDTTKTNNAVPSEEHGVADPYEEDSLHQPYNTNGYNGYMDENLDVIDYDGVPWEEPKPASKPAAKPAAKPAESKAKKKVNPSNLPNTKITGNEPNIYTLSDNDLYAEVGKTENYYMKLYNKNQYRTVTLYKLLRTIDNHTTNEAIKSFAAVLRNYLARVGGGNSLVFLYNTEERKNFITKDGFPVNGFYDVDSDTIAAYGYLTDEGFENVVLHEAVHKITVNQYRTDKAFKRKIDDLLDHVVRYLADHEIDILARPEFNFTYYDLARTALSNGEEFISYGLTSSDFQKILSSIPAYDPSNVKDLSKSVFKQFLETIFDLIMNFFRLNPHLKKVNYNAFKELISIVDDSLNMSVYMTEKPLGRAVLANEARDIAMSNKEEMAKEVKEDGGSPGLTDLLPDMDYLSSVEEKSLMDRIESGDIELVCGL